MNLRLRKSLLISMGVVMAAISLLAFASMAASFFIADTTQGLATAINESGALRMRSYKIASYLTHDIVDDRQHWQQTSKLVDEFEDHLYSTNITHVLLANRNQSFHDAYKKIQQQWQEDIKPLFEIYLDGIEIPATDQNDKVDMSISEAAVINLRNRYFMIVSDFVNNIDDLVSLLEQNAEEKIKRLRNFQFFSLVLTVILVLFALALVYKRIQQPLKQLLIAAEHARKSDFSFHVNYTGEDELGRLGCAFNSMSEDLSKIYNELEQRVEKKTLDLETSNQSLELLYKTVNRLNEAESPHNTYADILNDIEKIPGAGRGAICLNNNKKENAAMIASSWITDNLSKQLCLETNCKKCLNSKQTQLINFTDNKHISRKLFTIPIINKNQQYGALIIELGHEIKMSSWQKKLLETIASHIAIAINISQQSAQKRRLALNEERGAIARELHDSLAQSLTFMKIQVSRLQALVDQSSERIEEACIISELRVGLNSAYKELRELLTTFRLKIDGQDFIEALSKTVLEFNRRSKTDITLKNTMTYYELTPNEEIHILQLIREALSNIVQHANASQAEILIEYSKTGDIQVIIKDNGSGIGSAQSKPHHYGLSIMKERAKTLNGHLDITDSHHTGTQVKLCFTPTNKTAPVKLKHN